MDIKQFGEKIYKLKDISVNKKIPLKILRKDVRNGVLISSGKIRNGYLIIESELNRYLDIINKKIDLSEIQLKEMQRCIGLNTESKLKRNGVYCKKDNELWNDLVSKDLAIKISENNEEYSCFSLNKRGIAYILDRSIDNEQYEKMLICPQKSLKNYFTKNKNKTYCYRCFMLNNKSFKF